MTDRCVEEFEALRIGLVQHVIPSADDEAHVDEASAIADVRHRQHAAFASADVKEAIAAMVEKRQPVFTGN